MSTELHRKDAPKSVRCFVLTISDTRTAASDRSGAAIAAALEGAGHEIVGRQIVRDDPADVRTAVTAQTGIAQVIVTTGGTGITSRDSTYEAITSAARQDARRLRRAVPCAQLRTGRIRRDAEPGNAPGQSAAPRCSHSPALNKPSASRCTKLILPEIGHVVRELER